MNDEVCSKRVLANFLENCARGVVSLFQDNNSIEIQFKLYCRDVAFQYVCTLLNSKMITMTQSRLGYKQLDILCVLLNGMVMSESEG